MGSAGHGSRLSPRIGTRPLLGWWEVSVYLESRVAILCIAVGIALWSHVSIGSELSNWDGVWYLAIVRHGYPSYVPLGQSTLGFFPLYPLSIILMNSLIHVGALPSALLVSGLSGFLAVSLVEKLVEQWWGRRAAKRTFVLICFFPGSVVFSMVYPEALTIAVVAGCVLALSRNQWVLAGVLAGAAGALEPVGLTAIAVCALAAWDYSTLGGIDWQRARRSVTAPILACWGIASFSLFLWVRTGNPLAFVKAQESGWHQGGDPVALLARALSGISSGPAHYLASHRVNLDFVSGLAGAVFLICSVVLLFRHGREAPVLSGGTGLSLSAFAWTVGVGLLTLWSIRTPPNPRILVTTFPAIAIWAQRPREKGILAFVTVEVILFVVMTALTFHGKLMTP